MSLLGFALLAEGVWSALLFRTLAGIALAGTYMPGLKALTDRLGEARQPRAVAFYTASFGIGVSLSFLISDEVAAVLGWQWAFAIAAAGAPLAFILAGWALTVRPGSAVRPAPGTHLFDFRPVFANREAMSYILAYAAHNWELFGYRGWLVAFLVFSQAFNPDYAGWNVTLIATLATVLATPASIVGGELAMRFGRPPAADRGDDRLGLHRRRLRLHRGAAFPLVVGLALFYGIFVSADSAAITTGALRAAPPDGAAP